MIIAIDKSSPKTSRYVRAILGRFMWRIDVGTFLWPRSSIKKEVIPEVQYYYSDEINVSFYWRDGRHPIGYHCHQIIGKNAKGEAKTLEGLLRHTRDMID